MSQSEPNLWCVSLKHGIALKMEAIYFSEASMLNDQNCGNLEF